MMATSTYGMQMQNVLDGMFEQRLLFLDVECLELLGIDIQGRCAVDHRDTDGLSPGTQAPSETEQQVAVEGLALEQANHRVFQHPLGMLGRLESFGKVQKFSHQSPAPSPQPPLRCFPADRLDRIQDDIIILVLAEDFGNLGDLDQGFDQAETQVARQRADIGNQVLFLLE